MTGRAQVGRARADRPAGTPGGGRGSGSRWAAHAACREPVEHRLALAREAHDELVPHVLRPSGTRRHEVVVGKARRRGLPRSSAAARCARRGASSWASPIAAARSVGLKLSRAPRTGSGPACRGCGTGGAGRRARSSSVVTKPPSPVIRFFVAYRLNIAGPNWPARRPRYVAPCAWAGVLDDREAVPVGDRDERVHVGHEPVQVDRHDRPGPRRDRRLDQRRDPCRSRPRGRRRRPGVAPARRIALTVALNVKETVMTSSPGPMPSPCSTASRATVPLLMRIACCDAAVGRPRRLEARRPWPHAPACRSGGPRGRPASSAAPMSGREIGIIGRVLVGDRGAAAGGDLRRSGCARRHRWRVPRGPPAAGRCRRVVPEPRAAGADPADPARRAADDERMAGTSRVTTAPAPTVANRPTSVPATTTAPAPIGAARGAAAIGETVQSSARASSPVAVIARG